MNARRTSLLAVSSLGPAVAGLLLLAAPAARAQSAVTTRTVTVEGTVAPAVLPAVADANAENVRCSGGVTVTTRAVSDPPPPAGTPTVATSSLPPGVVVSIDAGRVTCAGQSSGVPFAGAGQANLTRRLAATDVVETTFPIYRDVPGGLLRARTAVLTLTLSYDTTTGALTGLAATLGSPR